MKKIKKYLIGGSADLIWNNMLSQINSNKLQLLLQQANLKLAYVDIPNKDTNAGVNIEDINSYIGMGLTILGAFNNSQLSASSGGEAAAKSITSALGGLASGAAAGSVLGPIGTVVGAAAGLVAGSIGKKGSVTSNGFGQDPTLELGTGLIGGFTNRRLRRLARKMENAAENNRSGMLNTANALLNFYKDYDTLVNTMLYGGYLPADLAYVDDGETINTPDGDILEVPEKHQPVDSNLVNIPDGSKILSNTLKVPGTKKTYAQMYKDLSSKRKSNNKDIFAENSRKLNLLNDLLLHDELFNLLEMLKNGKKESKYSILEFQIGGSSNRLSGAKIYGNGRSYVPGDTVMTEEGPMIYDPGFFRVFRPISATAKTPDNKDKNPLTIYYPNEKDKNPDKKDKNEITIRKNTTRRTGRLIANDLGIAFSPNVDPMEQFIKPSAINITQEDINRIVNPPQLDINTAPISTPPVKDNDVKRNNNTSTLLSYLDLGNSLLELAPVFSNLLDRPESFSAQLNPYRDLILRTMSNRRYNINPALREIQRTRDITNYNAGQLSPNTGASMAFRLQNAVNTNNAISNLYSQKDNIDNQYQADYANVLDSLGQQYVQALNMATDLNARSRAASRNINRTGLSQLSQWVQRNALMRNQARSDKAMLELFGPYIQTGYTDYQWNRYLNNKG